MKNTNKIDKPFARQTEKRYKTQLLKSRTQADDTANPVEVIRVVRGRCEQLHASELDNADAIHKFLGRHKLLKLT